MRRRNFLGIVGGAMASAPFAVRAQQPDRVRRIGALMAYREDDEEAKSRLTVFLQSLKDHGWNVGNNIQIDYRWAGANIAKMKAGAKELNAFQPDLFLTMTTPAVLALKEVVGTTPVIFLQVSDPVGSGLVTNLARPEGNITGFTNFEFSIGGRWLQLIKEISPGVVHAGVIYNPATAPYAGAYMKSVQAAEQSFSIKATAMPVADTDGIEPAIEKLAATTDSALIVLSDIFTTVNRDVIVSLARKYRLPAIYPFKFFVTSGGLVSYGIDQVGMYVQAGDYADRILKGTPIARLPIQQPTKFELAINLKTAKALGFEVPATVLAQADEVIE
jgi:putative tryptophan/tyrosine transport system substrate-binding protein